MITNEGLSPCSLQAEFNLKPDSLYFNDGQRRIDFVLVYGDESKKEHPKKSFHKKQKVGLVFWFLLFLAKFVLLGVIPGWFSA